ncbi:hypothetical protein CYMTET_9678 [Cymbomonas tetramitiformis]|uniref:Protein-tyrosine-phosphatase n=1 Tax=Cymbomonas tetramitiformis TaxID=36881 RepID=A0AAE0LF83_9CHLO|nr:hypothetical protein CYMTET_9678 [Cymbomonas tetramitiformis]
MQRTAHLNVGNQKALQWSENLTLCISAAQVLREQGDVDGVALALADNLRAALTNEEDREHVEAAKRQLVNVLKERGLIKQVRTVGASGSKEYRHMQQILPNLWLGPWQPLNNGAKEIIENNITHVVSVVRQLNFNVPKHIQRHGIRIDDRPTADLLSHFDATFNFIDQGLKEGAVFVHCGAGVSRSATIVIGYIMYKLDLTFDRASDIVRCARPYVRPNEGFVKQLKVYAKRLQDMKQHPQEVETQQRGTFIDVAPKIATVHRENLIREIFWIGVHDRPGQMV